MGVDPLRQAHPDGLRLQEAIDTEYRTARREGTWARAQPQFLERWRTALRAWTLADWLEVRNALAGKLAVLGAILEEGKGAAGGRGGATPPRSVWRKR